MQPTGPSATLKGKNESKPESTNSEPQSFSFSTEETPGTFSFSTPVMSFPPVSAMLDKDDTQTFSFSSEPSSATAAEQLPPALGLVRDNTILPTVVDEDSGNLPTMGPQIQRNLTTAEAHGTDEVTTAPGSIANAPVVSSISSGSPSQSISSPVTSPITLPGQFSTPILVRDPSSHSFHVEDDDRAQDDTFGMDKMAPSLVARSNTSTCAHGFLQQQSDDSSNAVSTGTNVDMLSPTSSTRQLSSRRDSFYTSENRGSLGRDDGFDIPGASPSVSSPSPTPNADKRSLRSHHTTRNRSDQDQIPNAYMNGKLPKSELPRATTGTNNHVPATYAFDAPTSPQSTNIPKLGRAPTVNLNSYSGATDADLAQISPSSLTRMRTIANDPHGDRANGGESRHAYR